MIFDVVGGSVAIGGKVLRGNMSLSDTVALGFAFEREIDMKTGWVFRTASRDTFGLHTVAPALGFQSNRLQRVSVAFLDEVGTLSGTLADRHRDFLSQELGAPSKTTITQALYVYPWGQIAAEQDARNGTAYIIVTWQ